MKVDVISEPDPFLARVIIKGEWEGNRKEAENLLRQVSANWPAGTDRVKFIITCGGFINFDWPKDITQRDIPDATEPPPEVVEQLIAEADKAAKAFLEGSLNKELTKVSDYITLGFDSQDERSNRHIELVLLAGLSTTLRHWTGKSYPTCGQQRGLVRITDLRTHFIPSNDIGRIMLLGCFDFRMFVDGRASPGGWKKDCKKSIREMAKSFSPELVLHHPHSTDSARIWSAGSLFKLVPSVQRYASAGRYYYDGKKPRSPLDKVRQATKRGLNTIDFKFS